MAPATFAPNKRPTAYAPVENGVQALLGVLPGARVTSGYRGPDNPLSRANPRSWHTKSHAAVDIAPMQGTTYDQALGALGQKYGIIESRDEAAHPFPWTTGPNWHFVLGKRQ